MIWQIPRRPRRALVWVAAAALCAGPALGASRFPDIPYAAWTDQEPPYRFYPGDEIEVAVPSAPELTRSLKVGPDGRVSLPLIGAVMAADRTAQDLEASLSAAYATRLRRPQVEIALKQAAPLKIFVGGEVAQPGVYEMPGDIDAAQAIIMAGGLKPSARATEIVLLRRSAGGGAMMRTLDLRRAFTATGSARDRAPLRRFDIVYAPRSKIGEVTAAMQQLRDMLPLSFSYSLNSPYR